MEQLVLRIIDCIIEMHVRDEGYDYTIYNSNYQELDGGIYDNPDISLEKAMLDVILDMGYPLSVNGGTSSFEDSFMDSVSTDSNIQILDYDSFMEKVDEFSCIL